MTLVAIWWHRISQGSDGKFSNWSNFQKMLASFWKNSIIISAEIYPRFFYVFYGHKKSKTPYGCGCPVTAPKILLGISASRKGFCALGSTYHECLLQDKT